MSDEIKKVEDKAEVVANPALSPSDGTEELTESALASAVGGAKDPTISHRKPGGKQTYSST